MRSKFDGLAKSQEMLNSVIPAKAGIQYFQVVTKELDPGFHRGDGFLRIHQVLRTVPIPLARRTVINSPLFFYPIRRRKSNVLMTVHCRAIAKNLMSHTEEVLKLFQLAGKLKEIKRTGWEKRQINLPESVADHSFRVAFISMILADELGADPLKLLQMSIVHDLAESIVGDITPYCGVSVEEKRDREEKAIREIFSDIPYGDYCVNLWIEYEEQRSIEAIALKNIDKFEMALQATEYGLKDESKDLSEFIVDADKNISMPAIKSLMQQLLTGKAKWHTIKD